MENIFLTSNYQTNELNPPNHDKWKWRTFRKRVRSYRVEGRIKFMRTNFHIFLIGI
ncbi:uncharacterized protein BDZ83DRAFT_611466 [Colletotrichum acutatum]|uniref:Uncharacterized protein n=1 Tax=Glomerella acutata TaxID=27357 RepID=A0AAD8UQ35_GLOAC|nr:uncharacterized protein BDZ83DRAFT_611466 [Colletotrichum acutatum]KAK1727896.1 hypothetical protein BDZ83DRAFT_611466 [Colletotrichum acutatum]